MIPYFTWPWFWLKWNGSSYYSDKYFWSLATIEPGEWIEVNTFGQYRWLYCPKTR